MKEAQLKTLSNGLRVLFLPYQDISSIYIAIEGLAGSNYESINHTGIAHFLEHYLFNGSKKYPDKLQILHTAENNGGFVNAGTGRRDVEYYGRFLKQDLELGFDLISQMVLHPLFDEKHLKAEKEVIRQEAKSRIDKTMTKHYSAQDAILYPDSRKKYPTIGRLSHISKTTMSDLKDFYKKNYHASNFVLSIAGDVEAKQVFDYAEKYFGDMPSGIENEFIDITRVPYSTYYVKKDKNLTQANVSISFDAPPWGDDMYAASILSLVLGGSVSSRLLHRLRVETGYVYSVNTRYYFAEQKGSFNINLKIRDKYITQVLAIVQEELNKISSTLITDIEHERAKKIKYAGIAFLFDNPPKLQSEYTFLLRKKLFPEVTPKQRLQRYLDVTKEDIQQSAQKIFSSNNHVFVVSPTLTKGVVKNIWSK